MTLAGLHRGTIVTVASTLVEAPLVRVPVLPSPRNGLKKLSQLMSGPAGLAGAAVKEQPYP